ncbi:MAG TPA: PadR family transcriptional regulator [Acidimicrobiales bacterium]|nr:PadR family transcriptional regulator [Acidimicrobiales bacterium]
MLELAILGVLKEQSLHGYELKKQLVEITGPFARVSFGSLYPALARLEAQSAVRAIDAPAAPPVPATGSLGAELAAFKARRHTGTRAVRGRKVYEITDRGHELFDELLVGNSSVDDERGFGLRLAFARYLAPDARLRLLERRRAHLVEQLVHMQDARNAARDSYRNSLLEHSNATTEADINWLDGLIAAERGSSS